MTISYHSGRETHDRASLLLILCENIRNGTGMIRCNITDVEAVVCLYCRKISHYLI